MKFATYQIPVGSPLARVAGNVLSPDFDLSAFCVELARDYSDCDLVMVYDCCALMAVFFRRYRYPEPVFELVASDRVVMDLYTYTVPAGSPLALVSGNVLSFDFDLCSFCSELARNYSDYDLVAVRYCGTLKALFVRTYYSSGPQFELIACDDK